MDIGSGVLAMGAACLGIGRVQTQSVCSGQYTVDVCVEDMRTELVGLSLNWFYLNQPSNQEKHSQKI